MATTTVGRKASDTIEAHTHTISLFRNGVRHGDITVGSCFFGDVKYAHDMNIVDKFEVTASKTNIEKFLEIFPFRKLPKVEFENKNYLIDVEDHSVSGNIQSFETAGKFYRLSFPFYPEETYVSNSRPVLSFSCNCPRAKPQTGSNLVVDKHMKFFGNLMADLYKVRNFNIFGSDSEGFAITGKIINRIGQNPESYKKLPEYELTPLLIDQRFYKKPIDYKKAVSRYLRSTRIN